MSMNVLSDIQGIHIKNFKKGVDIIRKITIFAEGTY